MSYEDDALREILEKAQQSVSKNGTTPTNGHPPEPEPQPVEPKQLPAIDYGRWRLEAGYVIKRALDDVPEQSRRMVASMPHDRLVDLVVKQAREIIAAREAPWWPLPPELSESDVEEELHSLAGMAIKVFRSAYGAEPDADHYIIPFEDHAKALQANEAYLQREPVVAGLYYSSAISMITGGKHAGKSTLARWLAICVAKGYPFLDRQVQAGHVLYLASEDEALPARQELMRLGWVPTDPLQFLSMGAIETDQVTVLASLTDYIKQTEVRLIVMDMLFDWARITDEMSYSQTREALGTIQRVASAGKCHIVTVHHAPKHAAFNAEAGITALGSMGLAARVSPVVLVRKHGMGVHSLVSTSVRDPRGEALVEKRMILNPDGSVSAGGIWKDWMQAEVWMPKVLEVFEQEPGQEMTRADVQEALAISQQLASACLKQLHQQGVLTRAGSGKKGQPFRYAFPLSNISPANADSDGKGTQVFKQETCVPFSEPRPDQQQNLNYKDRRTPPGDDPDDPTPRNVT